MFPDPIEAIAVTFKLLAHAVCIAAWDAGAPVRGTAV